MCLPRERERERALESPAGALAGAVDARAPSPWSFPRLLGGDAASTARFGPIRPMAGAHTMAGRPAQRRGRLPVPPSHWEAAPRNVCIEGPCRSARDCCSKLVRWRYHTAARAAALSHASAIPHSLRILATSLLFRRQPLRAIRASLAILCVLLLPLPPAHLPGPPAAPPPSSAPPPPPLLDCALYHAAPHILC